MNFNLAKLPNKITPCPIAEAVVELRFETNSPVEVLLGRLFEHFKTQFPKLEKLPVLDIPSVIRDNDPNLRYAAYYRLSNDKYQMQLGPRSFSVVNPKEYTGWTSYSALIKEAFGFLQATNLITKPLRIGVRYISFFEKVDIFPMLKFDLQLSGNSMIGSSNVVRSEFDHDGFKCIIQIANNSMLNNKISGSSIDLDIIRENDAAILTNLTKNIELAHDAEKKIFFSLLKDEFLAKFNPEYL